MNSGNPQFERDFEAFLSGDDSRLAALYRKLPQAEPDARLDAAVQVMAQRSVVTATPNSHTSARRRHWLPLLSAAAVVALAAGIAFQIGPQLWQRPASQSEVEPVAIPSTPPPAAPPPAEMAPSTQKAAAPAATAAPAAQAPAAESRKMENAASRPAPRAFPAPARAMQETTPAPVAKAKPSMPAPAMAAPMQMQQADAVSAGAVVAPVVRDRNATLYPEHWLANIRQMLRDNRREDALRSLDEFRKRYPDYRLPDDLRDLH